VSHKFLQSYLGYGGLVLGLSQFLPYALLPQRMMFSSKVMTKGTKSIIYFYKSVKLFALLF
jgi:hypothetical protein